MVELLLVLGFAWKRGAESSALRIVLTGVALQALCVAGASILTFLFADRAPSFSAFLVGSLNGTGWRDVALVTTPAVVGLVAALASRRSLDLLLLDEATAAGRGLDIRRTRVWLACVGALLAAAAVSVAGLVGFVGLVIPNALRLVTGPSHRLLIPVGAVAGGALVVLADAAARSSVPPLELPVGALLALVGGPYFLWLLWSRIP
jgi:iron complex transport system permease protein